MYWLTAGFINFYSEYLSYGKIKVYAGPTYVKIAPCHSS